MTVVSAEAAADVDVSRTQPDAQGRLQSGRHAFDAAFIHGG